MLEPERRHGLVKLFQLLSKTKNKAHILLVEIETTNIDKIQTVLRSTFKMHPGYIFNENNDKHF